MSRTIEQNDSKLKSFHAEDKSLTIELGILLCNEIFQICC